MSPSECHPASLPDRAAEASLLSRRLRAAIESANLPLCEALVDEGADLDAVVGSNATLLTHAIVRNFREGVYLLLDRGASVDSGNSSRRGPLHAAASQGDAELCRDLIDRGARLDELDRTGLTALHEASKQAQLATCAVLLESGAKVDATDVLGRTPLHRACGATLKSTVEVCRWLLENGADPQFTPENPQKEYLTPFQWAVAYGFPSVVAFFLTSFPDLLEHPTLAGRTAVEIASAANRPAVLAAMTERAILSKLPNEDGGLPKKVRFKGFGPL